MPIYPRMPPTPRVCTARASCAASATALRPGIVLHRLGVRRHGPNFVLTMLRLMREREVSVVCDQIGTPTWAAGIAAAIWGLIEVDAPGGVYHWTDLGVATWYDFAVAIQDEALMRGLLRRAVTVTPIPTAAHPTRAQRPAFSVDTSSTRAMIKCRRTVATVWDLLDDFAPRNVFITGGAVSSAQISCGTGWPGRRGGWWYSMPRPMPATSTLRRASTAPRHLFVKGDIAMRRRCALLEQHASTRWCICGGSHVDCRSSADDFIRTNIVARMRCSRPRRCGDRKTSRRTDFTMCH